MEGQPLCHALDGSDDEEDETKHPDPGGEGRSRHQLRNFWYREIWVIVFSKICMSKRVASRLEKPLPTPTLITARRLGMGGAWEKRNRRIGIAISGRGKL
jgi:hypothetical protein